MIKTYEKLPVRIKAMKFEGYVTDIKRAEEWLGDNVLEVINPCPTEYVKAELMIGTLEGPHKCSPGDYIIQGIKGEFYPCKPDIFEKTYRVVKEIKQNNQKEGL